jgi:hypothetical protein
MPKSVNEVRVGVDGVVAIGAFGSVAPTSALSTLDAAYADYGYVSEDGVTESTSVTSEQIRAWQKAKVVRTSITEATTTWQFVLIQTSAANLALYYGGTVAGDGSIVVDPAANRPLLAFVLDVIDGTKVIRKYAPEAQITEIGDQVFANGEPIGYEVTVTANYNEALGGAFKQWDSSIAAASVPTLSSATPTAATAGSLVTITGNYFNTVVNSPANVKFGATNATNFTVVSDSKIIATVPAGTAGAANITVINPTGTSTALPYTRGA